jgi:uncharacterized protein (DUF2267 family)/ribosome-associated translation inhibitor RaiA
MIAVDYDELVNEVAQEGGLAFEDAERALRAALKTLGERLSGGQAREIADHLPEQLRPLVTDGKHPEPFGVDEFLHRLARREGVPEDVAARHALAVFAAVGRAVGWDEVRDMEAELPRDFRALLVAAEAAARPREDERVPTDEFVRLVAAHGGLDADTARRAADAVLDALGERLSSGEVEDLAALLSDELARALRRGSARSKDAIRPLSLVEFERRISDHESVAPDEARRHARAVLAALRDAVGEKEFSDALAQLPDEFRVLLDPAGGSPEPGPAATGGSGVRTPTGATAAAPDRDAEPPPAMPVELHVPKDLPRSDVAAARERMASLQRYTDRPILSARLTLRHPETRQGRARWIADASVNVDGRLLAAHATGRSAIDAADAAVDRLRRQLRRVVGKEVARRNEPRVIDKALSELAHEVSYRPELDVKKPHERKIVHRRRVPDERTSTLDAIAEMLDADQEFRLFREEMTGEWLVVYRREDGRAGLIHPPWVPVHERHGDMVVVEPSPYSELLTLDQARAELERSGRRFVYFVDAEDGRPKVLYLRHDGDYGLVEPAVPRVT